MVDKERSPTPKGRVREVAERLGLALGARALWELVVKLLNHH
jgi:hypothetical protein